MKISLLLARMIFAFAAIEEEKRRMKNCSFSLVYMKIIDLFTAVSISIFHYSSYDPIFTDLQAFQSAHKRWVEESL